MPRKTNAETKKNTMNLNTRNGKITKAKSIVSSTDKTVSKKAVVKLNRMMPLGESAKTENKRILVSHTPFSGNSFLKCTSTPMPQQSENNPKQYSPSKNRLTLKDLNVSSVLKNPLSPILTESSGNAIRKKLFINKELNKKSDTNNKENYLEDDVNKSVEGNQKNENYDKRRALSRRSFGRPKIAVRSINENEPNNYKDLHVRLARCSAGSSIDNSLNATKQTQDRTLIRQLRSDWSGSICEETTLNKEPESKINNKNKQLFVRLTRSKTPSYITNEKKGTNKEPSSLVKHLQSDWSNITLGETPMQTNKTSDDENRKKAQVAKRRLAPLIELSMEERSINTRCSYEANGKRIDDDDYSSSAEFENDDEIENSRSKRAPTWKDLLNKTTGSLPQNKSRTPPKTRSTLKNPKPKTSNILDKNTKKMSVQNLANNVPHPEPEIEEHNISEPSIEEIQKKTQVSKETQSYENSSAKKVMQLSPEKAPISTKINPEKPAEPDKMNRSRTRDKNLSIELIENILSSSMDDDNNNEKIENTNLGTSKHTTKFFHSRIEKNIPSAAKVTKTKPKKRSTKKVEKVYDFLSQSSQSDSNDPMADVIQKMIESGKVTVAKHKKGSGTLKIPKTKKAAQKKTVSKRKMPDKHKALPKITVDEQFDFDYEPVMEVENRIDEQEEVLRENKKYTQNKDNSTNVQTIPVQDTNEITLDEEQIRDQRGFSDLARSVMIKHAKRREYTPKRKSITDKKTLLEMAKKFVNQSTPVRQSPEPMILPQMSPMPGSSSPWRASDDLPHTFYFSRNNDNLPSFSSDHIPLTPSKRKSKSSSSSSLNDSNMENIAPSVLTHQTVNQESLNNRRALSSRSPLKAIQILDVVELPPLAMHTYENKNNNNNTTKNNSKKCADDQQNKNRTSLFGFEEFIDEDEDDMTNINIDQSILPNRDHLKEKLEGLKRLRPQSPLTIPSKNNNRIKPVFDDERRKQKTLKQMFSSTMIEKPNPSNNESCFNDNDEDLSNLFKDPDPDTTFDTSKLRRTYSRPFKRKRKLRNNFVMFMDSDASEDDELEDREPVKQYAAKPKKRSKKTSKPDPELKKFVNEFNEMCKEVSQYELIVE